jgi:hypothetical protein
MDDAGYTMQLCMQLQTQKQTSQTSKTSSPNNDDSWQSTLARWGRRVSHFILLRDSQYQNTDLRRDVEVRPVALASLVKIRTQIVNSNQ